MDRYVPRPLTAEPLEPVKHWPSASNLKPAIKIPKPAFGKRQPQILKTRTIDFRPRGSGLGGLLLEFCRVVMRNDSGVAAVEFGLIVAALAPVFIYGGEQIGPPLLAWASGLHADVVAAQQLCQQLGCQQ